MENPIETLRWRGMIQDITPGAEAQLSQACTTAYVGFDPTADSLHVGSLMPILLLAHLQRAGHRPIALVGGATGRIGDPSGKAEERKLIDLETLQKNVEGIRKQLTQFIDFSNERPNAGRLLNNYDWMKSFSFVDFARQVGKHLTVNYMMAKDSVKKRLGENADQGMSFTEFTYPLLQGYDFVYLNEHYDCKLQMGGSDQWGNMTTGTELLRKMRRTEAFALTCPLLTKADGSKFGKSEGQNIWLDPAKTSPYTFYQFWLNTPDSEAEAYIKIFTLLQRETLETLIDQHHQAPQLRLLQKRLAAEVTQMVHGSTECKKAIQATAILFGKTTAEALKSLDEKRFLSIFKGVSQAQIDKRELRDGMDILTALVGKSGFLPSKAEARRALQQKAISVNKEKVSEGFSLREANLINGKYLLLQQGKKRYFILYAT